VLWQLTDSLSQHELKAEFQKLESAARKQFQAEAWRGALHFERSLDLRYRGQGYELNIPMGRDLRKLFHAEHQRRYGYHHAGREIELVTLRLRAKMAAPRLDLGRGKRDNSVKVSRRPEPSERERVFFQGRSVSTPVYERDPLRMGQTLTGPAVITEYSATTVIPPGKKFWKDRAENLVIEVSGKTRI
jgi:N-methylhydantoinase A